MEKLNLSGPHYGNYWKIERKKNERKKERNVVDMVFHLVDFKLLLSF